MVIAEKEVEPLFDYSWSYGSSLNAQLYQIYGTGIFDSDIVVDYCTEISLTGRFVPGVTYTIQKALLDEKGNPGAFTDVTLYTAPADNYLGVPVTAMDITPDIFGNIPLVSQTGVIGRAYERSLTNKDAVYQYRVKAVKGGVTEYLTSSYINVSPGSPYISMQVVRENSTTYTFIPSVYNRNRFADGDKLVIYFVKGLFNAYRTGPYTEANSITFTKAELEGLSISGKLQTFPPYATDQYIYAQAYLVHADGSRDPIQGGWSGTGYWGSYSNNGQTHRQLYYY
jgi:hypothetical protein